MQGSGNWLRKLAGLILVFLWMPLGTVWAAENLLIPEKLDHEAGLYYTVKKGDTLWDISQRFSDSPWLWHDLWRMNPHIANPHEIEPGTRVRLLFQKGTQDMPLPPPPPLPKIPRPPKPDIVYYPSIAKAGFILSPAIEPLGDIFMVKDHKKMVGTGDIIYISPRGEEQPFVVGNEYLVYDPIGPIVNKALKINYGFHHLPTGLAKIVRIDHEFAIAEIVASYRTIHKGQSLTVVTQRPTHFKVRLKSPRIEGRIIKAEEVEVLFGQDHIVFLDKGEDDGILSGQRYSIYRKESRQNGNSKLAQLVAPKADTYVIKTFEMGQLVVLFTHPNTATALITNSNRSLQAGDFFGVLN